MFESWKTAIEADDLPWIYLVSGDFGFHLLLHERSDKLDFHGTKGDICLFQTSKKNWIAIESGECIDAAAY